MRDGHIERTIDRFWSKVDRRGPDECWLWQSTRSVPNKIGAQYGSFGITGGKVANYKAHRFAYILANGDIPDGMVIMHTCDVTLCVNPDHLKCGTPYDNSMDMVKKGRVAQGMDHHDRRLNREQVLEIFDDKDSSNMSLGRKYGVHNTQILKIRRGDRWKRLLQREGRI